MSLSALVTLTSEYVKCGRNIMSNINTRILRDLLLADYKGISQRLTRRLRSADLASEAIQETYLRIEGMGDIGSMRNPAAYLLGIALNIARDYRRAANRRLTSEEVDRLLEIPDDRPDPEDEVEKRSEVNLLRRAIAELPERRRQVLTLSRIEGVHNREIAKRFGVTVRTIEIDLKQAIEHCAERLKNPPPAKFGFRSLRSSNVQRHVAPDGSFAPGAREKASDRDQTNRSTPSSGSPHAGCTRMDRATEIRRRDAGGCRAVARLARQKSQA
jgi:RNA polymerase sigma factor (sigma-70 family)